MCTNLFIMNQLSQLKQQSTSHIDIQYISIIYSSAQYNYSESPPYIYNKSYTHVD